jgi:hypothetical protein
MSVKITAIRRGVGRAENPHVDIQAFQWINEETQRIGVTDLTNMYDWIVNKEGKAYVMKEGRPVYIFGATTDAGEPFLRTVENQQWTDDLINLPPIS